MSDGWCTIESDPAVFTEMLERFGVRGVAVEELITLEPEELAKFDALHGLVLLFKWKQQAAASAASKTGVVPDAPVYFAQQIVQNACATQAIVNIVLNHPDTIDLGDTLRGFLDFTNGLDPRTRGEQIGESGTLREVHNSFSRPAAFSFEDRHAKDDDDVYHFIAYTHCAGAVWELDGLQQGPVRVAAADSGADAQAAMRAAVQARIAEVSAVDTSGQGRGISFALMAVVADRVQALGTQLALLQSAEQPCGGVEAELSQLREERERGKLENARRRHNYLPAIVALLRTLAAKGHLEAITREATERAAAKPKAGAAKAK